MSTREEYANSNLFNGVDRPGTPRQPKVRRDDYYGPLPSDGSTAMKDDKVLGFLRSVGAQLRPSHAKELEVLVRSEGTDGHT